MQIITRVPTDQFQEGREVLPLNRDASPRYQSTNSWLKRDSGDFPAAATFEDDPLCASARGITGTSPPERASRSSPPSLRYRSQRPRRRQARGADLPLPAQPTAVKKVDEVTTVEIVVEASAVEKARRPPPSSR
ncbi:MAG: hypothetical protein R3D33_00530 [Hyphomicrobiaceae bacterium]